MNALSTTLLCIVAAILFAACMMALFTAWTARKVESILPPKGRFVDGPRGGARLHVREAGPDDPGLHTAPAILMIHGLAGQSAHYSYGVMPRLAERFRLVAVDRPGSGHSPREEGAPADLATQAAAVASLIDKLGLGRPLVVGHSLGGAIALALALDYPDKVSGLALLAPLTHMQDAAPEVFKGLTIESPLVRKLVAWTLAIPASIKNSAKTLEQVFGPDAVPKDFATKGGGLLSLRPRAFLGASSDLQALPASLPRQQERYAGLRVPVHVLYGKDDRILDWKHNGQALVDKAPGARLQLTEGGHMLPITHAALCAEFIEAAALACAQPARMAAR